MSQNTLRLGSLEIEYLKYGCGPRTLVIIPGLSVRDVLSLSFALQGRYRAFLPDYTIYLFGVRKNLPENYTLEQYADDISAAMEALNLSDVCLLGQSMGGMAAQALAIRHPEQVSRLMLASTQCRNNEHSNAVLNGWLELAETEKKAELVRDMVAKIYSPATIAACGKYLVRLQEGASTEDLKRCEILLRAILNFNCKEELRKISCPVLVLGSDKDAVLGQEGTKELAEALHSEYVLYGEGSSHAIFEEEKDFGDRLRAFCDR